LKILIKLIFKKLQLLGLDRYCDVIIRQTAR